MCQINISSNRTRDDLLGGMGMRQRGIHLGTHLDPIKEQIILMRKQRRMDFVTYKDIFVPPRG